MSTKKKIYLYLAILIGVSLVFLVLILPGLLKAIREDSEKLISLQNELIFLQKEKENLKQLEVIYQTSQADLEKINALFVDPEVPVEFIDFLEKNGELSQQEIDISLVQRKQGEDEPWPSLLFQISTSGSFPNFLKFLERLQSSPYLVEILNLNIKKATKTGTLLPGEVESTFLIKVFTR